MKFKYVKLENELYLKICTRLATILYYLDLYTRMKFNKEIIITDLMRTQKEQDKIYKNNKQYEKKPWKSVHQFGRGADVRVSNFSKGEIEDILGMLNQLPYGDGKHKTALLHDIGNGKHIHIQVIYKEHWK